MIFVRTIFTCSLFIFSTLFADTELPFLTFSEGILCSTKTIFGKDDWNYHFFCYPVFSYIPPQRTKHISTNIRRLPMTESIDGDLLVIVDDTVGLCSHYFHFMEHLIGIWNFLTYQVNKNRNRKYTGLKKT